MKPYGYSRRLQAQPFTRICPYCQRAFQTRDPIQQKCKAKACSRAYDLERQHQHRDAMRAATPSEHLVAPALKQACDALEAQCTPENRSQWPQIIARFDTKPMPGYPNLARITRLCVLAKLRLLQ